MSPQRAQKVSGAYILRVISKNFRTINKKDPVVLTILTLSEEIREGFLKCLPLCITDQGDQ